LKTSKILEWLLLFYSIPANPVNNRVRIWRKLLKIGAVQLKGGVYILPFTEEHHEALQWLLSELSGLKGEGLLIKTDSIEPLSPEEIIALFNEQRRQEYQDLAPKFDAFSARIRNLQVGGKDKKPASLFKPYEKLRNDFDLVQHRDFFSSDKGVELAAQIQAIRVQLDEFATIRKGQKERAVTDLPGGKTVRDYSGMTWLSRTRPFVDRMASAWLIRRFIDTNATFAFREEPGLQELNKDKEVSFDVRNGDFTHVDDLCTFEVLLKSFGLEGKALTYLSEIVHDIDIKDGKFGVPEAHTVEMILKGIRNRALSDNETLEQGMAIFEALYLSITKNR
jgi:hypothetical protein